MKSLNIKKKEAVFSVPTAFVDRYMPLADDVSVKVYLYLLRHLSDKDLTLESAAKALGITAAKIEQALKYWNGVSVIKFADDASSCSVEFLTLDGYSSPVVTEIKTDTVNADETEKLKPRFAEAPKYLVKDINSALKGDKNISDMFLIAEQLFAKPLNHNDMKILYSFYDWLKLPADVIIMLLEHCTSLNKLDLRYIEKVAITWADNGIDSFEKANVYIKSQAKLARTEKKIKRILQISGRDLTEKETEFVRIWIQEYKASESKIKEAYEITVINTGKMNFKYMDAVLKNLDNEKDEKKPAPKKKTNFNNFGGNESMNDFERKMLTRRVNGEQN